MAGPTPSWNTVPLFGTWRNYDGTLKAGSYKVTSAVRVTNTTDDVIVPAGLVASGTLNEKEAVGGGVTRSLYLDVPASDDPDNDIKGWQLTVEVTFKDSPGEKYTIETPLSSALNTPPGVNLRKVILPQTIPVPASVFIKGVPGGLAVYDADGDVVDAAGNKVTGGGSGGSSGPVYSGSITDASAVGKTVLTALDGAVARAAIGAGTSNLVIGTTVGTAKSGAYVPDWAEVTGKPTTFAPTIGTTATTAKAGNYVPAWGEITAKPATFAPTIGTGATDAKAGNYVPAWTEVTGKPATFAPSAHTHTATDLSGVVKTVNGGAPDAAGNVTVAAGAPTLANLPAGSVLYTATTTRPTSRTDVMVIFTGADPGSAALDNDMWWSA